MDERSDVLDGALGIDRIVKVKGLPKFLRQPITFTVQERFRRIEFAKWKDVTITEWNNVTNQPSELYKIIANIFLYGYYDPTTGAFLDAIAFDPLAALRLLCADRIKFSTGVNPRSKQNFVAFTFINLQQAGCVIYWQNG
jgi:hypothetical protein